MCKNSAELYRRIAFMQKAAGGTGRMKKKRSLILLCMLTALLAACGNAQQTEDENKVKLYYVSNSEKKVEEHEYAFVSSDTQGQLEEVIRQMTVLPDKLEYKPPLAMGFSLLDYAVEENRLLLNMDKSYHNLTPVSEVLVRAALVRSFTQVSGIRYVSVTVEGEQLHDSLGKVVGMMSAEQFIDNEGSEINNYEKVRLKLYFANEKGDGLVSVNRSLAYNTNIPMEKLVMEQLLAGPGEETETAFPTLSPETKLLGISTKDGICYVNLDQTFLTQTYNCSANTVIYSIVNSLTELTGIHKVQILINGENDVNYRETYNLTTVFERNLDLIQTAAR